MLYSLDWAAPKLATKITWWGDPKPCITTVTGHHLLLRATNALRLPLRILSVQKITLCSRKNWHRPVISSACQMASKGKGTQGSLHHSLWDQPQPPSETAASGSDFSLRYNFEDVARHRTQISSLHSVTTVLWSYQAYYCVWCLSLIPNISKVTMTPVTSVNLQQISIL